MNLWDLLILLVLAAAVVFALRSLRRPRGCCAKCGSCPAAGSCTKTTEENRHKG